MAHTKHPARRACYGSSVTSSERHAPGPQPAIRKVRKIPTNPTYQSRPSSPQTPARSFDSDASFSVEPLPASASAYDIPEAQIDEDGLAAFELPPLRLEPSLYTLAKPADEQLLPACHCISSLITAYPELVPRILDLPAATLSELIFKLDSHAIYLLFNSGPSFLLSKLQLAALAGLLERASDSVFAQAWQLLGQEEQFQILYGQENYGFNALMARIVELK
jgi:hypothetical protein